MTHAITTRFRLHNASQFFEAFGEAAPSNLYFFVGRSTAWPNEPTPPDVVDTIDVSDYQTWRHIDSFKKIQIADVSHCIPRYDWATNTLYQEWNSNTESLWANTFYTITDDRNVYKCMYNNLGANSTVKPTGTTSALLETSDGYTWKFMYSISASLMFKFRTTDVIPVKLLAASDGSDQWTVQDAAVNGAIEVIDIGAAGTGYTTFAGNVASANTTTITLESTASGTDDLYNFSTIYISGGLGSGQIFEIINHVGSTKVLTTNGTIAVVPNTQSLIHVGPKISIIGDGDGAQAYANTDTNGAVTRVHMINVGADYSQANAVIEANGGSGAVLKAYTAPYGGHGSNPVFELGGYGIIIDCSLIGNESNTIPTDNDYRIAGLIKDPLLESNGAVANATLYTQSTKLTLTGISGAYIYDEVITGADSGAKATVVNFSNTNLANTAGVLRISNIDYQHPFEVAEVVTGSDSGKIGTIATITAGDLTQYTGEILYVENRTPITRAIDQIENFKMVFNF